MTSAVSSPKRVGKINSKLNFLDVIEKRTLGLKVYQTGYDDTIALKLYSSFHQYEVNNTVHDPHVGGIFNLEFSLDGKLLVAACQGQQVLLFDAANQKLINTVESAHQKCVNCVRFLNDRHFATCSDDTSIKIWDVRSTKTCIKTLHGHSNWVKNIEWSEKDDVMVTSAFDGSIYAWNLKTQTENNMMYDKVFLMNGLMRMKLTDDGTKMVIATTNGYMIIIHDLNLMTLATDLRSFRPNLYRLMQISDQCFPVGTIYNYLFSPNRSRNRIEFIDDFPNEAEVISSLQIHPHGWCAVSRNINGDESEEWTTIHDIQDRDPKDYEDAFTYIEEEEPDESEEAEEPLNQRPTDLWMGYISLDEYRNHSRDGSRMSQNNWENFQLPAMGILNSGLIGLNSSYSAYFRQHPEQRNKVIKNLPRMTHFKEEKTVGKGFIKELCFSSDGRMVASPYDRGVRLLAFNEKCQELSVCVPDHPQELRTIVELNDYHKDIVVSLFTQDDDGPYRGKYLGKLNSYHHQVSGDVYAVNDSTLLLTSFSYDGNGADTFFWAGAANRPGPQGFIVPDLNGKTNVLERYFNKDFTLILPESKKITDIKWFAIYDIWSQNTFGDIYVPEEFEPPTVQKISTLTGKHNGITTGSVDILDAKRIRLNHFTYDGKAKKAYFWVGVGAQPVVKGYKVPDEYGYLDPLRAYRNLTIVLELPGDLTIFDIDWFSVFDHDAKLNLASIIIPEALNVPPSLVKIIPHKNDLPNCLQLHKDFQVSWEIFGPQITIQLAGQVDEDEYLSFGISGSQERSQMVGADVAVAYIDGYRGFATDYNITALTPCVKVLGQYKGVCKDEVVGGQDSNQMNTAVRENGVNIITYRRQLISPDPGDKEFPASGFLYVVWGIGKLDENMEPAFHDLYSKTDIKIEMTPKEPQNNCLSFTRSKPEPREPWKKGQIFDKTIRIFKSYIGPSGAKKGYQAITGHASTALSWYINGMLTPEIWLRRGLSYVFKVYGGNNPHSAEYYHPLIITDEPHGGFDKLTDEAQSKIRVLAGVEYSRRGRPRPTAAGPLCLAQHPENKDRRLDDDYESFKKFNRTLMYTCEEGEPGVLEFTPNSTWPDTVYYNSFTQANMGWKIHIVDSFNQRIYSGAHTLKLHNIVLLVSVCLFVRQLF